MGEAENGELELNRYKVSVVTAAAAAKSLQSCPTLCDPTDGSPPGSPVPGILQARALEWGATAFSEVSVREDEKFLKMDSNRDALPTKYMCLMLLNFMVKFILCVIFTTVFKFS